MAQRLQTQHQHLAVPVALQYMASLREHKAPQSAITAASEQSMNRSGYRPYAVTLELETKEQDMKIAINPQTASSQNDSDTSSEIPDSNKLTS